MRKLKNTLTGIFLVAVLIRSAKGLAKDQGTLAAAGISYYAFLSVFPLTISVVLIFGLFMPDDQIRDEVTSFLQDSIPASVDLIDGALNGVLANRTSSSIFSIIALIWVGSAVFGAVSGAINRAWGVEDTPPMYLQKPKQLAQAASVALIILLSLILSLGVNTILSATGFLSGEIGAATGELVQRGSTLLLSFIVFMLLYYVTPNTKTDLRGVLPGAVLAAVTFEIGKSVFAWYLSQFASFSETYGPLAGAVVLLVWLYYSGLILVMGAEFSVAWWAEREKRGARNVPAPGPGRSERAVPSL